MKKELNLKLVIDSFINTFLVFLLIPLQNIISSVLNLVIYSFTTGFDWFFVSVPLSYLVTFLVLRIIVKKRIFEIKVATLTILIMLLFALIMFIGWIGLSAVIVGTLFGVVAFEMIFYTIITGIFIAYYLMKNRGEKKIGEESENKTRTEA